MRGRLVQTGFDSRPSLLLFCAWAIGVYTGLTGPGSNCEHSDMADAGGSGGTEPPSDVARAFEAALRQAGPGSSLGQALRELLQPQPAQRTEPDVQMQEIEELRERTRRAEETADQERRQRQRVEVECANLRVALDAAHQEKEAQAAALARATDTIEIVRAALPVLPGAAPPAPPVPPAAAAPGNSEASMSMSADRQQAAQERLYLDKLGGLVKLLQGFDDEQGSEFIEALKLRLKLGGETQLDERLMVGVMIRHNLTLPPRP